MTKVNADNIWHLCITSTNGNESIETTDKQFTRTKIDVFNYLMYKKSNNYPYAVCRDETKIIKDLKGQVCEYCQGRVWVHPISPNQIKLLKLLAIQLGFTVKIMVFCKHKVCLSNRPPSFKTQPIGVTYINEHN